MYGDVLRPDDEIIGFADDIMMVAVAKHLINTKSKASTTIAMITKWRDSVGLFIAPEKKESVLSRNLKRPELTCFNVDGHVLKYLRQLKYIGFIIDGRIIFEPHAKYVTGKTSRIYMKLSRMLHNLSRPRSGDQPLRAKVATSILLCARSLQIKSHHRYHRFCALRDICAYKTTSGEAALVISDMAPIGLLYKEGARVHRRKALNNTDTATLFYAQGVKSWKIRNM